MLAGCTIGLLFTLKVEAITSSETSVNIRQNTRRHMQEALLFTATIHTIRNDLALGTIPMFVCMDGGKRKNLTWNSRCPSIDLNQISPKYKSDLLPTVTIYSVTVKIILRVVMKCNISQYVTQYRLVEVYRGFGETYCLHLHDEEVKQPSNGQDLLATCSQMVTFLAYSPIQNVFQTTRRHIPKASTLHGHHREDPKSSTVVMKSAETMYTRGTDHGHRKHLIRPHCSLCG